MNRYLIDAYNSAFDGDEWGNVQAWCFAVAHVLWHLGECPDEWQYRHGLCVDGWENAMSDEFEESELQILLGNGQASVQDIVEFGSMLNNLRDILVNEGKDY